MDAEKRIAELEQKVEDLEDELPDGVNRREFGKAAGALGLGALLGGGGYAASIEPAAAVTDNTLQVGPDGNGKILADQFGESGNPISNLYWDNDSTLDLNSLSADEQSITKKKATEAQAVVTAFDRTRNVYPVSDYADIAAAIAAAIADLPVNNWTDVGPTYRVTTPAGNWQADLVANPIEIPRNKVIYLNARGTSIQPTTSDSSASWVKSYSGSRPSSSSTNPSTIDGLRIFPDKSLNPSVRSVFDIYRTPQFKLRNIQAEHFSGYGIRVNGSWSSSIEDFIIEPTSASTGIRMDGAINDIEVKRGRIHNCGDYGIFLREPGQGVVIDNVDIEEVGTNFAGDGYNIYIANASSSNDGPITIRNCYLEETGAMHINVDGQGAILGPVIMEGNVHGHSDTQPNRYVQAADAEVKIDTPAVFTGSDSGPANEAIKVFAGVSGTIGPNIGDFITNGGFTVSPTNLPELRIDAGQQDLGGYTPPSAGHVDVVNTNSSAGGGLGRHEAVDGSTTWSKL